MEYSNIFSREDWIMIRMQTLERARRGRRAVSKPRFEGFVTDLIVPDAAGHPRPQAFLVEQAAHWSLATHFHLEHQFQAFVGGSATLGKHPVGPLTVHYASPHSAYGPLNAGDAGISYLTMRLVGDEGAWYLPEARPQLKLHIKKQQAQGAPATQVSAAQLGALERAVEEVLIEPHESGLGAWIMRLPPSHTAAAPLRHPNAGGRFYVVTQGALRTATDELAGLAAVSVTGDESFDITSGAGGLEVLVLQFPGAALQAD